MEARLEQAQNTSSSIKFTLAGIIISSKLEQLAKARYPIDCKLLGNVIDFNFKLMQSSKAELLMLVILFGKLNDFKPVHLLKELIPITFTPSLIFRSFKAELSAKALFPILSTLPGIVTDSIAQPLKAEFPIVCSLSGRFKDVSFEQ